MLVICETWPTTKGYEDKIAIFKRRILRTIYGPKRNNVTQQYESRSNIELQQLYNEPDIAVLQYTRRYILVEESHRLATYMEVK